MNKTMVVVVLLNALVFLGTPVSSYANHTAEHQTNLTLAADGTTTPAPPSDGKGAAKGCATGAAIGTAFAPGAGTLLGCVIAGVWGWFW